jgi:hypothetical protein
MGHYSSDEPFPFSRQARLGLRAASFAGALLVFSIRSDAQAASLTWKGHTWNVTSGGMAGVAAGSPSNVSVDSNGYLHLKITNNSGTWSAAELFTTDRLGFGTYQWQVDGPIDVFDKNVVLGLFPYGPAAGIGTDGTNEIDIEYSFWGQPNGNNGDFTNYPASGNTIGELSFRFSLNGSTFSTSRFIWTQNSIQDFLLSGFQAIGSTTGLIKTWTYAPNNPTVNIPQQALPLGINLWCFDAPPSDGKNVEVVIRDFEFAPEGSQTGGAAGIGGSPGTGGASGTGGTTSTGGRRATGGMPGTGGAVSTGGAKSTGGTTSTGGTASTGGSNATGGAMSTGGSNATGGAVSTGGSNATGGAVSTGGSNATGGAAAIGGASALAGTLSTGGLIDSAGASSTTTAGASTAGDGENSQAVGSCTCRVARQPSNLTPSVSFGLLGLLLMEALRRRRRAPGFVRRTS